MKSPHEILEIYDLDGNIIEIKHRQEFYDEIQKEFEETGKITKKVKAIRVLLMTTDGRIYLQRRSDLKAHNRGLYDKTTGGHFMSGHTWEMTVVREMVEELGIPTVVLPAKEFTKAIETTDVSIIGIFKEIDYDANFLSVRTTDSVPIEQPFMTTFYVGYYDGSIRFRDGEASGIEVHTLTGLKADIQAHPEKYTQDLKVMLQRYEKYLVPANQISEH
ncbi:MAG: NUDIX domain-containing protein [Candidatus Peribacteraceae bacterium]|jgi:isopentenyldiphosphate isomerase